MDLVKVTQGVMVHGHKSKITSVTSLGDFASNISYGKNGSSISDYWSCKSYVDIKERIVQLRKMTDFIMISIHQWLLHCNKLKVDLVILNPSASARCQNSIKRSTELSDGGQLSETPIIFSHSDACHYSCYETGKRGGIWDFIESDNGRGINKKNRKYYLFRLYLKTQQFSAAVTVE